MSLQKRKEQHPQQDLPAQTDPGWSFDALRQGVDRLFEDFSRTPAGLPFGRRMFGLEPLWRPSLSAYRAPAVDIVEQDKSFEISVELPGMEEKDLQVRLSNGHLVISGEKRDERKEERKDYHLSERHYGSFERVFSLPKGVDADHIEAHFSKGVLKISLPKHPDEVKPEKVIQVKSG